MGSSFDDIPIIRYLVLWITEVSVKSYVTVTKTGEQGLLVIEVDNRRFEGEAIIAIVAFGFIAFVGFLIHLDALENLTILPEHDSGVPKIHFPQIGSYFLCIRWLWFLKFIF